MMLLMTGEYFQHTNRSMEGMGVYKVLGRVCYQLDKNVCGYLHSFMLREKKQKGNSLKRQE